jgi:hypothetical protein
MGKQEYDFHFIWKVNYGLLAYFVSLEETVRWNAFF